MRAKAEGPDLKGPVEIHCGRGDPATGILRMAEEDRLRPDRPRLARADGGLGRLLMGSVAEAVLPGPPAPR